MQFDLVVYQDAQLDDLVVNKLLCDGPDGYQGERTVRDQLERLMLVEQDVVRDRHLDPLELADQEVGQRLDALDRLCFLVVNLFQVNECIDDQLHNLPLHDEHMLAVSQHLQQFLE